jgi:hypothetical protein
VTEVRTDRKKERKKERKEKKRERKSIFCMFLCSWTTTKKRGGRGERERGKREKRQNPMPSGPFVDVRPFFAHSNKGIG